MTPGMQWRGRHIPFSHDGRFRVLRAIDFNLLLWLVSFCSFPRSLIGSYQTQVRQILMTRQFISNFGYEQLFQVKSYTWMQLIYLKNEFFYNPQVSIHQMKFDSLVNLSIILLQVQTFAFLLIHLQIKV